MKIKIELLARMIRVEVVEEDYLGQREWFNQQMGDRYRYTTQEYVHGTKYNPAPYFKKVINPVWNPQNHTLPFGLLHDVYAFLHRNLGISQSDISFDDVAHRESNGRVRPLDYRRHENMVVNSGHFKSRYYQEEAVDAIIANRFGHVTLPTGAGKTFCMLRTIEKMKLKISLIVVYGEELMGQTYKLAKAYFPRALVKRWDSKATTSQRRDAVLFGAEDQVVIVASYKSFSNYIGSPIIDKIDGVFLDEIQKVSCKEYKPVVEKTPYAYMSVGFSATPFRDDNETMLVVGYVGREIYRKEIKDLVDEGYLARPVIKMANMFTDEGFWWLIKKSKTRKIVVFHEKKSGGNRIGDTISGGVGHTQDTLRLIAEDWPEPYRSEGMEFLKRSAFIFAQERDCREIIANFKTAPNGCVFTTPLMDVGVDIPDISIVILLDVRGKKSGAIVQNIQRIGRALRRPNEDHTQALAVIHDDNNQSHFQPRKPNKLYNCLTQDPRAYAAFDHGDFRLFDNTFVEQARVVLSQT
jgi:superfamily II DNA or RNA helicase